MLTYRAYSEPAAEVEPAPAPAPTPATVTQSARQDARTLGECVIKCAMLCAALNMAINALMQANRPILVVGGLFLGAVAGALVHALRLPIWVGAVFSPLGVLIIAGLRALVRAAARVTISIQMRPK